jgi:putative ABC transport system substrate-binding protein
MDRRRLLSGGAMATGLVVALSACGVQAPWAGQRRRPRIGYGSYGPREAYAAAYIDPFVDGLRELGYTNGQTIDIDWRFTSDDSNAEFQRVVRELVDRSPDVLVSGDSVAIGNEMRQATTTIPIVAFLLSPVENGMVGSLARPGSNLTGVSADLPGGEAKYIELLREVVPHLESVALIVDNRPSVQPGSTRWELFRIAAESVGIQSERVDVTSPDDVEAAFETLTDRKVQAFSCAANGPLRPVASRVAELAVQHRLASMNRVREWAALGFPMSIGPREADLSRRLASYVDTILKGASPSVLSGLADDSSVMLRPSAYGCSSRDIHKLPDVMKKPIHWRQAVRHHCSENRTPSFGSADEVMTLVEAHAIVVKLVAPAWTISPLRMNGQRWASTASTICGTHMPSIGLELLALGKHSQLLPEDEAYPVIWLTVPTSTGQECGMACAVAAACAASDLEWHSQIPLAHTILCW